MKKNICFFSVGFAFNRLVRLKYYEKIFPKDTNIFLYTTNKYEGKEKQNYQYQWTGLKRTKIVTEEYNLIKTVYNFRMFCKKNNIDRVYNLGFHNSWPILYFACISTGNKRDYCLNVLTDIFNQYHLVESKNESLKELLTLLYLWPGIFLSKKTFFTDRRDAIRAPRFFLSGQNKMKWLAAPVNTDVFTIKDKSVIRRKLKISPDKRIVIFVGRINYLKCSDILKKIIESNPELYFILVGRLIDESMTRIKSKNYMIINFLNSDDLVDYYNASDFSFCLNRGGGGIGLSSEEALACGLPIVVCKEFKLEESKSLYQVQIDFDGANKAVKDYFNLPIKEREILSKLAREYVKVHYSDDVWKEEYIKSYLE